MKNIIRELERNVYLTISAVRLRCAEKGNVKGWLASNDIAGRCTALLGIDQGRKPLA